MDLIVIGQRLFSCATSNGFRSRRRQIMGRLFGGFLVLAAPPADPAPCVPVTLEAKESLRAELIKTGVWGNTVDGVESTNVFRRVSSEYMTRASSTITSDRSCLKQGLGVETFPFEYRNDQVFWDPFTGCPHVKNSQTTFEGTNLFTHDADVCL